jgi:hypothetical protein
MEAHPLRGVIRWLIYPLLATCAGCLAGLAFDLYQRTGMFTDTLFGGIWGGAIGCGMAVSGRKWIGFLITPMLGSLGDGLNNAIRATFSWTWKEAGLEIMRSVGEPKRLALNFVWLAPVLALHWLRLRRPGAWPLGWLAYAGAAAGVWLVIPLAYDRYETFLPLSVLARLLAFYLGSRAALEWALKLSGAQLGKPSSRTASS